MAGALKPATVMKRLGDNLIIAYLVCQPSVRRAFGHRTIAHTGYYPFDTVTEARAFAQRMMKGDPHIRVTVRQFQTLEERDSFIRFHPKR